MKRIISLIFFKNFLFLGKTSYNYKMKSFIIYKKNINYIFNLTYSVIYLKKALKFIEKIVENRGLILFLGSINNNFILKFININNGIKLNHFTFSFKNGWFPGLLMRYKNIKRIPDLLIILDADPSLYIMIIKEANLCKIPVIFILDSLQTFDIISYGIPSAVNYTLLSLYENLFCTSLLNGLSKEKFKIK